MTLYTYKYNEKIYIHIQYKITANNMMIQCEIIQ